tara:strand:- start:81 stop:512 length:432 start_codon:yes stop_codon:yes gene_type:complete
VEEGVMVKQPIPELVRLFEKDRAAFEIEVINLPKEEYVPFFNYKVTHKATDTVILFKESSKVFPDRSIYSQEYYIEYTVSCGNFTLSELEQALLITLFKKHYKVWEEEKDSLSEDNKSRDRINKILFEDKLSLWGKIKNRGKL